MMIKTALVVLVALLATARGDVACNSVHYWTTEGVGISRSLMSPPNLNTSFHDTLYSGLPDVQPLAATGCAGPITFSISSLPADFHYTTSAPGYTPVVGPFALQPNGDFYYINVPSLSAPNVWNGYDSFVFMATCTADTTTCTATAFINVIYTSAALQNAAQSAFQAPSGVTPAFENGIQCQGSCTSKGDGMWLARQTLPRIWDMQLTETQAMVMPSLTWDSVPKPTDGLDLEWQSNWALVSTYGVISNMAARFPTFEVVQWVPGQTFGSADVGVGVAALSTGFDQLCLDNQGAAGQGTDVWQFNADQQDGTMLFPGSLYNTGMSWYQKFGGKHYNCNIFQGTDGNSVRNPCHFAPLLTPRVASTADEDNGGVWRLSVNGCNYQWQGKFTWNGMLNQKLKNNNANAWLISGGGGADYTITSEMYNQAVQPNSWTDPTRGVVEIDHKYLLTVTLSSDTTFQFELGIDIFTVDLQQFRQPMYNTQTSSWEMGFGYNMIVYPTALNALQQSAPDRRIIGFKWVEAYWVAPNSAQCAGCGAVGSATSMTDNTNACVDSSSVYSGAFPDGNCPAGTGVIFLTKGPSTTSADCTTNDPMVILNQDGISPANPDASGCKTTFQNVTLRGRAVGSSTTVAASTGFGFEGKITLTFALANGEHPHFVLMPQMYVKSISVDGAFAGTSSTCRGSPYWPVGDTTTLPQYICEEPDARTFGPTDWAAIFFDIKDVPANLVTLTSLYIVVDTLTIRFYPAGPIASVTSTYYDPEYTYFNFRNLKDLLTADQLATPSAPAGVVPPENTDFGFAFTPGAHNQNTKITIYCTLQIQTARLMNRRRFARQDATTAQNTVQERIDITPNANTASSLAASNVVAASSTTGSANAASAGASNTVTVMVLAAACAVLLAAVIGMVLYVVRNNAVANAPKRIASGGSTA